MKPPGKSGGFFSFQNLPKKHTLAAISGLFGKQNKMPLNGPLT